MNTVHHSLTWCVYSILSNCLSDLRLICCTKYVLGFKEGSRMGAQFIRQYDCKGRISRFWHHQKTLEQKSRIKSTVRSDLNSQAISKRFGSVFSREFISKDRLSYNISYDRFPNRLNCMNIHIWPSHYPIDHVSQSRVSCVWWAGCNLCLHFL